MKIHRKASWSCAGLVFFQLNNYSCNIGVSVSHTFVTEITLQLMRFCRKKENSKSILNFSEFVAYLG